MRQLINENDLASIDLTNATIQKGGEAYYLNYQNAANSISKYAFYQCLNLTSIILPTNIIKIDTNAFANSGLIEVEIPNNVTTVGGDAFAYSKSLSKVTIGSKMKTMGQGVFYSSPVKEVFVKALTPPTVSAYLFSSNPVIHVYAKALNSYKKSDWAQYGTIVGDLDSYTDIETPSEDPAEYEGNSATYDMNGRKVTELESGKIYVRKGKKFIAE